MKGPRTACLALALGLCSCFSGDDGAVATGTVGTDTVGPAASGTGVGTGATVTGSTGSVDDSTTGLPTGTGTPTGTGGCMPGVFGSSHFGDACFQ